jgi:hypothetical protein
VPVEQQETLQNVHVQVPLLSLPRLFNTTLATVPAPIPYIFPEQSRIQEWQPRFCGPKLNIGIAWAGNSDHGLNRYRSCHPRLFSELRRITYARFFSLQKGPHALSSFPAFSWPELTDLDPGILDFDDTAAIIANLDLVVTVDTSVAHLAGAMGKPVWLVLSATPDWRWMLNRADSPWYPSMRLFRQAELGDWTSAFKNVLEALKQVSKRELSSY